MNGGERFARKSKQQNGNEKRFCLLTAQKARDENPNCGKPGGRGCERKAKKFIGIEEIGR